MFEKILKAYKSFFASPRLRQSLPELRGRMHYLGPDTTTEENAEDIAVANFNLQKEALQKNLILVHRSVMVALFAALVAIVLGVVAVVSKPNVTLRVEETSRQQAQ